MDELPPEAEERLRQLRAAQAARREQEDAERRARRGLWLSHHWPDEHHRCATVGGRPVCRRCLTLYPIALVTAAAGLAGFVPWPDAADVWLIWLLCVPATLEFLLEKLRGVPYHPARQIAVTALVGVALGRGLALEIDDRWSWSFWGPVIVFGAIWFTAALVEAQRRHFARALETSLEYGAPDPTATSDDPGDR